MIRPNYKRVAEYVINPGPSGRTLKLSDHTHVFEKIFDLNETTG